MLEATAAVAEAKSSNGTASTEAQIAPGSTGGTDGAEEQLRRSSASPGAGGCGGTRWKQAEADALERCKGTAPFSWDRPPGGWWCERAKPSSQEGQGGPPPAKVTALCGATAGGRCFVQFLEAGEEVYEESEVEGAGVFVKVVGGHSVRRFSVPSSPGSNALEGAEGAEGGFDVDALRQAVAPIHFWVNGVAKGSLVLLALVAVPPEALPLVLEALAPLGVPQTSPPREARALAAVGCCTD